MNLSTYPSITQMRNVQLSKAIAKAQVFFTKDSFTVTETHRGNLRVLRFKFGRRVTWERFTEWLDEQSYGYWINPRDLNQNNVVEVMSPLDLINCFVTRRYD